MVWSRRPDAVDTLQESPKLCQKLIGLKLGNVFCLQLEIKVNTLLVAIFATETLAKLFALGCGGFWRGDASWRPKPRAVEVVSVSFRIVRGQVKPYQLVGYESTCWLWYLIPRKVFSRKWCRIDLKVFFPIQLLGVSETRSKLHGPSKIPKVRLVEGANEK